MHIFARLHRLPIGSARLHARCRARCERSLTAFCLCSKGFDHQLSLCKTDKNLLVFGAARLPLRFVVKEPSSSGYAHRQKSSYGSAVKRERADKLLSSIKGAVFSVSQLSPFFIKALRIQTRRSGRDGWRSLRVRVHRHTLLLQKNEALCGQEKAFHK